MFRGATRRVFRLLPPLHRSSFLLPFRSVRAAAGMPAARPFFARIACVHAPAFAPARSARLIARARAKRRAQLFCPFLRVFCAGARRETKQPPDAASFCLILPLISENQALIQDLFLDCANLSGRIAMRASSAMLSPSPASAAPGKARLPKAGEVSRHVTIRHEISCSVMFRAAGVRRMRSGRRHTRPAYHAISPVKPAPSGFAQKARCPAAKALPPCRSPTPESRSVAR